MNKGIDKDNMFGSIWNFPENLIDAKSIGDSIELINEYNDIQNVVIVGMGGSAIGADFARAIVESKSCIPIFVLRDYSIPNWVDEKTFVIASSYSGNTEETLIAYNKCLEIGCNSIAISTADGVIGPDILSQILC